jgi:hypothetical protein
MSQRVSWAKGNMLCPARNTTTSVRAQHHHKREKSLRTGLGLRHFAEQISPKTDLSIEQVTAGLWMLFEEGSLRLASSGNERLGVEACGENRAERRVQARKNRRLVEFKRQMAREGAEVAATSK